VVALTKRDLADPAALAGRRQEVGARLAGTRLEGAPIIACSSTTGEGLDEVRIELDEMLSAAPAPETNGRPRQFLDRVFTIRGAGTVVTGTLTGGPLEVGREVEVLPSGLRARIRGLQTHKRSLPVARPVSRVAVNLAGTAKQDLERGDVLTMAGQWRSTSLLEGWLRPVRGLDHAVTGRGAYKLYAGSAERDARLRLYGSAELRPGHTGWARISLSQPAVLDVQDGFVLREAGRRQTVAGGVVLDIDPPLRPGPDPVRRLEARLGATRAELAALIVEDRGAIRGSEIPLLAGVRADEAVTRGAVRMEAWLVSPSVAAELTARMAESLGTHHREHPLSPGLDVAEARSALAAVDRRLADPGLADAVLVHLAAAGIVARDGAMVKLPSHVVHTRGREDADRLVEAVRSAEPAPPTVRELAASGFGIELIRATCGEGRLIQVSPDIVVTPGFLAGAEAVVRAGGGPPGLTVSAFREALGTSRKYALPILEYFDARGVTRRQGDVRLLRG
jgi:selenocysteine-specific elongation factor